MMVYHIVALFCDRCVLGFVADDVWKCPFCRLKHSSASTCKTDYKPQHTTITEQGNDVVNRHYSRKLLKMDILMFETC